MAKIKQNIIILLILSSLGLHAQQLILGSERMEEIISSIDNKNLAIVGNQTSLVNDIHLVDTLLSLKQNIVSVFSPEHGFRGTEDAGAKIDNEFCFYDSGGKASQFSKCRNKFFGNFVHTIPHDLLPTSYGS